MGGRGVVNAARGVFAAWLATIVLAVAAVAHLDDAEATHTYSKADGHSAGYWRAIADRRGKQIRTLRAAFRRRVDLNGANGLERAFQCIHSHEGSWRDPNKPHWGGLQMDLDFQRTYGREFLNAWGTADNWPPYVQMTVAMRAYLSGRGFHPWPNTARKCGLL